MIEQLSEDSPKLCINAENCLARLNFEFNIKQTSYPYFEDKGYGYFDVTVDVTFCVDAIMSPTCLYEINYEMRHDEINIKKLHICIESEYNFIYESMRYLIENIVVEIFDEVQHDLAASILSAVNLA